MIYSVVYFCASYSSFVISYLLCFYLLLIVHLFCVLFDYLLFSFSLILCLFVVQKKKNNSDPKPCSGISILLLLQVPVTRCTRSTRYLFQHNHLESINIIQQTPPTLS